MIYDNAAQCMREPITGEHRRSGWTYVLRQRGGNRYFVSGGPSAGCFSGIESARQYDSLEDARRGADEDVPIAVVPECVSLARIADARRC